MKRKLVIPRVDVKLLARDAEKLMEPPTRRRFLAAGGGLGLAIAKRAIERQGGRIRAHNAEGGGLEVEICLPLI